MQMMQTDMPPPPVPGSSQDLEISQTQEMPSQETRRSAIGSQGIHARLTSLTNPNLVYEIRRDQHMLEIGRRPNCFIVVEDKRASGVHIRIIRDAQDRYVVEELSSNGCFINTQPVDKGETRALHHGDEISLCVWSRSKEAFAAYTFSLHNVGQAAAKPSASGAAQTPATGSSAEVDRIPDDHKVTEEWVSSRWDMRTVLGNGNFSQVKLGVDVKTGEKRAVKVSSKSSFFQFQRKRDTRLTLRSEAEVLANLSHPHIVKVYSWFETEEHLYLVMELLEAGDLLACILEGGGCFTEAQGRRLFRQLCDAVRYLHVKGIVHRDLKPENILVQGKDRDDFVLKLADFGLAWKHMKSGDCQTFCGTPHYLSPEVINTFHTRAGGEVAGYGKEVDVWSLGVILYVILSGVPPFEDEGLYEQITEGKFEFDVPEWRVVSHDAKDLVRQLMQVKTSQRLTINQAMEHRWLLFSSPPSPGCRKMPPPSLDDPSKRVERSRSPRRAESCAHQEQPTNWQMASAVAGS